MDLNILSQHLLWNRKTNRSADHRYVTQKFKNSYFCEIMPKIISRGNLVWFTDQFRISFPLNFLNKFLTDALTVSMEHEMTIIRYAIHRGVNIYTVLSAMCWRCNIGLLCYTCFDRHHLYFNVMYKKNRIRYAAIQRLVEDTNETKIKPTQTKPKQTAIAPGKVDIITFTICHVVFGSLLFIWLPWGAML